MIDTEATFALLAAVLRLWADDARRDPDELRGLAAFVGMDPCQMADVLSVPAKRRLQARRKRRTQ